MILLYDTIFDTSIRKEAIQKLKSDFDRRLGNRKIVLDNQFLVNYLLLGDNSTFIEILDALKGNFGEFRYFLKNFKCFQKDYLEFISYVCSKPNVFIPEEVFIEFRNIKSKRNRNIRTNHSSLNRFVIKIPKKRSVKFEKIKDPFCKKILESDNHVLSNLEEIIINGNILKNSINSTLLNLIYEESKNYLFDKAPSDVDKILIAYLLSGYDVFTKDGHVINTAIKLYRRVRNNPGLFVYVNSDLNLNVRSIKEQEKDNKIRSSFRKGYQGDRSYR